MATNFTGGFFQAIGSTGVVPGAKLYSYAAGTSTPLATYTDQGGLSQNTNPVICNALGQASVWLGTNSYKFILRDASDVQIGLPMDNITAPGAVSDLAFARTALEIAAGVTPTSYSYLPGDVRRYGAAVDGATDDTVALAKWLSVGGRLTGYPGVAIASGQLTLSLSGTTIDGRGMTIKAKASTNYEKVLYGSSLSNLTIRDLTIDVNQANRVSSLTQRSIGILLDTCTDCTVEDCTTQNAIGYTAISGFGFAFGSNCVRCKLINHTSKNCGIAGKAADGIFMQGTQLTAVNPTCLSCNDTGIAIESSQQSGVTGGTMLLCGAVCAITNAVNTTANDNYIDGLTGYDWDASVTGGIQIGNPLSSSTGNLLNTRLANITLHRNAGSGPAINVRKTGTAITQGLSLDNIRVKGAGTQCVLLAAQDVVISGGDFEGASNNPVIQLSSDCARVQIKSPTIRGQFTVGIYSDAVTSVDIITPVIVGDGVNSTQGVFFANTGASCRVFFPVITGATVARVGSDAGTTPFVVQFDPTSATHKLLLTKSDTQLLTTRQTGYTNPMTGTANRATTYDTATVTLAQLAGRVMALQADLTTHGLIGA